MYVRSGLEVTGTWTTGTWTKRLREAGARMLSAVGNLATPVEVRPPWSEAGVSTLVAAVTLAAGLLFLLVMLVTWMTR